MIKKTLKNMFPNVYKSYLVFRKRYYYNYYKSLDVSEYQRELTKIYKRRMNEDLDWNNLTTYNEKMQWAKLYDYSPIKTKLSDKYLVRDWVKSKIGGEYLIPLLGVWDSYDEIDFNLLPEKFVLKTNHGSGTNLIVKDKSKLNHKNAKRQFDEWLNMNFAYNYGFELQYRDIEPKIIAEKFISDQDGELKDYKFLCFDGEVYFCWIDEGRFSDHRRNVYNLDWELQSWTQHKYKNTDYPVRKPKNFELMVSVANKLCKEFSHVRIDLYNVNGKIYFGEMTFTNGAGYEKIQPKEYNEMLGELWKLPITVGNSQ